MSVRSPDKEPILVFKSPIKEPWRSLRSPIAAVWASLTSLSPSSICLANSALSSKPACLRSSVSASTPRRSSSIRPSKAVVKSDRWDNAASSDDANSSLKASLSASISVCLAKPAASFAAVCSAMMSSYCFARRSSVDGCVASKVLIVGPTGSALVPRS